MTRSLRSVAGSARRRLRALARTPIVAGSSSSVSSRPAAFPPAPPGWTAELRTVRWLDDAHLEVGGWAYLAGRPELSSASARLAVRLERTPSPGTLPAVVTRGRSHEVNISSSDADHDWSRSAFAAVLDLADLLDPLAAGTASERWVARIELAGADEPDDRVGGPFARRDTSGSAGDLPTRGFDRGVQVRPTWVKGAGLVVDLDRASAVAEDVQVSGRTVSAGLRCYVGFRASEVRVEDADGAVLVTAKVQGEPADARFSLTVPPLGASSAPADLVAVSGRGKRRPVHWAGPAGLDVAAGGPGASGMVLRARSGGVVRVEEVTAELQVERVELDGGDRPDDEQVLRIVGSWRGPAGPLGADASAHLRGPRQRVDARSVSISDGRAEITVPVLGTGPWGQAGVAPLPGAYRLEVELADGTPVPARVAPGLGQALPDRRSSVLLSVRSGRDRDGLLALGVGGPLPVEQAGAYALRCLQRRYRDRLSGGRAGEVVDAVVFESFAGKTANDNTLALHDEIHRRRPDLVRYWVVVDRSVPIPDGVVPVVHRSAEWFDVLATSRYVVTNCWLPNVFRRRPGQIVLQTWHGSAFKKLGLDRPTNLEHAGYRKQTLNDVAQWTYLLSQNDHTSEVFRRAYGYRGPILDSGYPRDDALVGDDGAKRAGLARRRLGLSDDQRVILYAPTFRHGGAPMPDLDHDAIVEALGAGTTVLLRGHSSTMRRGGDRQGDGIIDVTTYPEITDLYLIADVCITDYSSVMFDSPSRESRSCSSSRILPSTATPCAGRTSTSAR